MEKKYQKELYYLAKAIEIEDDNALYWKRYAEINLKLSFFEDSISVKINILFLVIL